MKGNRYAHSSEVGEFALERGHIANVLKNLVIVERTGDGLVVDVDLVLVFLVRGHGGEGQSCYLCVILPL